MRRLAVTLTTLAALSVATAVPVSATTDEDQVRAVLDGMNGSYNRSDFNAFASHLCTTLRQADGFEAGWRKSRVADGPTHITINSVKITGAGDDSRAVADVRFEAANHEDAKILAIDFLREGAEWKACRYDEGRSI